MTIVFIVLGTIAALITVMALNTVRRKPQRALAPRPESYGLDRGALASNLSGMIRIPTVTPDDPERFDGEAFAAMREYLEKTYPLIHRTLHREVVGGYSLLYKWEGAGSGKKPFLLMAHIDVVPADGGAGWEYPAFSGEIAGGYVWGRGALDMKGQLAAVMEAVEYLLREGHKPGRDIYIALGHDEERMGYQGNEKIAALLKERGVRFEFVIDEGGGFIDGGLLRLGKGEKPGVAFIGICEKGYADIRLTAESAGGHASRPPEKTAVGALAEAIVRLEKKRMRPKLNKPLRLMLEALAPYMRFPGNVIASNLFITKPLLAALLPKGGEGRALAATTVAPTMLKGSAARNVLAQSAQAVLNCRVAPSDSVEGLLKRIKRTAGSGVKAEILDAHEPPPVSPADSEAYRMVSQTVRETFGDCITAPYLMTAATDSRWYAPISDGVYLFTPFKSLERDAGTMHAAGERLEIGSLAQGTEFFIHLVKKAG